MSTLSRLATAVDCSTCDEHKPAHWRINNHPVCDDCVQIMASMNGENEELLRPAVDEMTSLEEVGK